MEVKYLLDEKNDAELEIDNQTVAEIIRIELSKDDAVKFVAWKRNQPGTPVILAVKTTGKTVRKAIKDAAEKVDKELDKFMADFKKAK